MKTESATAESRPASSDERMKRVDKAAEVVAKMAITLEAAKDAAKTAREEYDDAIASLLETIADKQMVMEFE